MKKISKRNLKLSNHDISDNKYNELKYFCLQYHEKLHLIKQKDAAYKRLEQEVELINQTAIEADSDIYTYIIQNVTRKTAYEYMNVPKGRRQFYESRRYFFYLLAQKR